MSTTKVSRASINHSSTWFVYFGELNEFNKQDEVSTLKNKRTTNFYVKTMSNDYNLQFRGDRRKVMYYDCQDDGLEAFLDTRRRDVRPRIDNMTGLRPRISFKQKTRVTLPRHFEFAANNYNDDDDERIFNDRQVTIKNRGVLNGRLGISNIDLRKKLTQVVLIDAFWYRITIPCGVNFEKDFIINKISEHIAPETFIPIMYHHKDKSAIFFVDNSKIAKILLNCDKKVFLNDNFRLHVYVKPGHPDLISKQSEMSVTLKDTITQVVARRYNPETNTLNLSHFHNDPALVENHFCALFQPIMLTTVLEIAVRFAPHLQILNLDGNKFTLIDRLGKLRTQFTNLKVLHLGDNLLKDINLIDPIRNLNLEELRLSGNPFCNNYSMNKNEYVSDVRARFPKLLRLDDIELAPPISFDVVEEDLQMPQSKKVFCANSEANKIASKFIQQYFAVFDNNNRQQLMQAYHEHAAFSMTVSPNVGARPNSYIGESRNLLRLRDPNRRRRTLKRGRLAIVSTISEFPQTRHDQESFTMDVSLCSESMMLVTVTGLFKEFTDLELPFRYFNRTLMIVPEGVGFVIMNEQLSISNATQLQQHRAMKQINSMEVPMLPQEPVMDYQSEAAILSEEVKEKMVKELSHETNMNIIWSHKCLTEVQWSYESALAAFQQFFTQGLIPSEAFEKLS